MGERGYEHTYINPARALVGDIFIVMPSMTTYILYIHTRTYMFPKACVDVCPAHRHLTHTNIHTHTPIYIMLWELPQILAAFYCC